MSTYGYIRVSSADQCEDRQCIALGEAGVPNSHSDALVSDGMRICQLIHLYK